MSKKKWIKLDELRAPAVRRVTDEMREVEEDDPNLLDEAVIAAAQMKKQGGDGGRIPQ
jgi:hypothetical protein